MASAPRTIDAVQGTLRRRWWKSNCFDSWLAFAHQATSAYASNRSMTYVRSAVIAFASALLALAAIAGCSRGEPGPIGPSARVGFLAVGDTGYDYRYLERDDYDPPRSMRQFLDDERVEWIEDGHPPDDFDPPPTHQLPSGAVVAATGLRAVAQAMELWCQGAPCDFGTILGDNIYPDGATAGADGGDDSARFRDLFIEPFAPLASDRSGFRYYVTLGNHDWNTSLAGAESQLHFHETTSPFYMDGYNYRVRPASAGGQIELFVIDTELLLSRFDIRETSMSVDGRGSLLDELDGAGPWVRARAEQEPDIAVWLEQALASSDARWKIVVGHHPLWSSAGGKFAQAAELRRLILPALCRHADLYLAGHEHTLEMHADDCSSALPGSGVPPLVEVVSGAGAKQRPVHGPFSARQQIEHPELQTLYARGMVWGFAHVQVEGDTATIRLISTPDDASGRPVVDYTHVTRRRSGLLAAQAAP